VGNVFPGCSNDLSPRQVCASASRFFTVVSNCHRLSDKYIVMSHFNSFLLSLFLPPFLLLFLLGIILQSDRGHIVRRTDIVIVIVQFPTGWEVQFPTSSISKTSNMFNLM
jgi:hypothetical protein